MTGQMRQTAGGTGVWCIHVWCVNRKMFTCACFEVNCRWYK